MADIDPKALADQIEAVCQSGLDSEGYATPERTRAALGRLSDLLIENLPTILAALRSAKIAEPATARERCTAW